MKCSVHGCEMQERIALPGTFICWDCEAAFNKALYDLALAELQAPWKGLPPPRIRG